MLIHQIATILKAVAGLGAFFALVHFVLTLRWASLGMAGLFGLGFFWPSSASLIMKVFGPSLGSRMIPNNKSGLIFYLVLVLIPVAYYFYTDIIMPRTAAAAAAGTGEDAKGRRGQKPRRRRA